MTRQRRARRERAAASEPAGYIAPGGLPGGQYRPLTEQGVRDIHEASLRVLEEIGIEVFASEARDILAAGGARVDAERNRVFIPREMVEQALSTAANEVTLYSRDGKNDLVLGGTRVYMGTGGAAVKILDLDTGHERETTLADVAKLARLVDSLDSIHFYHRPCVARDIPSEDLDVNTYYAGLLNTTKHVVGNCFSIQTVRDVLELTSMVVGGMDALRERPIVSFSSCWTVSPLRYAPETVEVLLEIVRQGMPVFLSSAPQSGATSPAALAGTMVQINAEELSGIVLVNLVRPGAPAVMGFVPSVSDLRTGNFVGGAAEFALMNAAAAQLGQFYNIPVYNSSGLTDSKIPDAQAGYEKGLTSALAALAGSNYIHHSAGMLESMLTIAYEAYVMDDDINAAVMRAVRGIEVTPETLSIDVIRDVVAGEGHYLGTPQSLALMHTEYQYPHTADRQTRDRWEAAGGLTMREAARQRACEILASHRCLPVPPEVDEAIRARFNILLPRELATVGTPA